MTMTASYEKPVRPVAGVTAMIEASGLGKAFGDHVVLNGIDLSVPEGSVFALLGPNGAGKTTMVRILATLSAADAGDVRIAGYDIGREPMAVRSVIGVTGQFSATDAYLIRQL
jgi:ABC-2 type transport system ATP-binding protein